MISSLLLSIEEITERFFNRLFVIGVATHLSFMATIYLTLDRYVLNQYPRIDVKVTIRIGRF